MNEKIQAELQSRIESFAADVTAILQRAVADSVASALSGAPGRRGRRASAGAVRSLDADVVLREVKRKAGQRVEELAKNLHTSTKALKAPLAELMQSKKVKKSGAARGTNYRAA
jgi:hypothetical protein